MTVQFDAMERGINRLLGIGRHSLVTYDLTQGTRSAQRTIGFYLRELCVLGVRSYVGKRTALVEIGAR